MVFTEEQNKNLLESQQYIQETLKLLLEVIPIILVVAGLFLSISGNINKQNAIYANYAIAFFLVAYLISLFVFILAGRAKSDEVASRSWLVHMYLAFFFVSIAFLYGTFTLLILNGNAVNSISLNTFYNILSLILLAILLGMPIIGMKLFSSFLRFDISSWITSAITLLFAFAGSISFLNLITNVAPSDQGTLFIIFAVLCFAAAVILVFSKAKKLKVI